MNRRLSQLARAQSGATAAEFAMVLPLLLLLLFGIIDTGRFMWAMNSAEKATQVGARVAVVTTPVSPGLIDADFASPSVPAGELIPADSLGAVTCTQTQCTCGTGACPIGDTSVNATAFSTIVTRMSYIYPQIDADDVKVIYRGSGFGFAGAPITGGGGGGAVETMEVSPLVTVELSGMKFTPITTLLLAEINLPAFTTTLTSEDASGQFSN